MSEKKHSCNECVHCNVYSTYRHIVTCDIKTGLISAIVNPYCIDERKNVISANIEYTKWDVCDGYDCRKDCTNCAHNLNIHYKKKEIYADHEFSTMIISHMCTSHKKCKDMSEWALKQ